MNSNSPLNGDKHYLENQPTAKNKTRPSKDVENADYFDPFAQRDCENSTTDGETLTHLLKASLGTGILSMPYAFRSVGFVFGISFTLVVAFFCTYCAYILVKSAHVLYYKCRKTHMSYAEVAETSLQTGPASLRKFSKTLRWVVDIGLFVAYYTTCIAYAVIIAKNLDEILFHHFNWTPGVSMIILYLMIPLILCSWIPDLKYLAPFSMVANVLMGSALVLIIWCCGSKIYYDDVDDKVDWIGKSSWIEELPVFLSITIFAIEAIGVIMPLENKMKTPKNFVGLFGVLNKGMSIVTMIYIFLGVIGYLSSTEIKRLDNKILNDIITYDIELKIHPTIGSIIRIAVAFAVFFTFALQFFVCLDAFWRWIKNFFQNDEKKANYALRTIIVVTGVGIAHIYPDINPFISIVGSVCFSILGFLVPAIIESVTYWEGDKNWVLRTTKNVIIGIIAMLILVFGTIQAIKNF